jgi:GNAT superfamily N-acetyltransferase
VDEIYGGLWAPPPLPVDEENWHSLWIAVWDAKIIGVVRTSGEWLDDLWVLRESRGYGVGQRLLAQGEAEIIARGYETLHLYWELQEGQMRTAGKLIVTVLFATSLAHRKDRHVYLVGKPTRL